MSQAKKSTDWFKKSAMVLAMVMILGLPAIYWASKQFLGMDVRKSVGNAFSRIFSHSDSGGSSADTDTSTDDGGD